MIRIIVIIIIIIAAFWSSIESDRFSYNFRRKLYINFVVVLLALQSGLRHMGVGADTLQYFKRWELVKNGSWNETISSFSNPTTKDPFYTLFQKFLQLFSENFQFFLLIVAFMFMVALGNFVKNNTQTISQAMLSFMIYMGYFYGFYSITGIRQTLASVFLLFSYEYVKKEKFLPFLILVLVGALFHVSALVFLPLYFVAKIKNTKLIFGAAIIGFPIFMFFKNEMALVLLATSSLEDRFSAYAEQYRTGGSFILTAFQVLLGVYALIIMKKVLAIKPIAYKMYNTFALALFFLPLQWVNPSAGRIAQYFAIIIMVFIPYILDATAGESKESRKGIYSIAVIGFFIITLFSIGDFYSYKFFWQEMNIRFLD
jgi:hypothetical protein